MRGMSLFRGITGCLRLLSRNCERAAREVPMARSDLLISLVKAGTSGDTRGFRSTAEAIIAEERAKRHDVLAERLTKAIQANGNGVHGVSVVAEPANRGRDFISEVVPRRCLEELILPKTSRQGIEEL